MQRYNMAKLKRPYRNHLNQRYSNQLFLERWSIQGDSGRLVDEPPFTLFSDKEGFINFGQEYINDGDLSGYKTCKRLLGDYGYWAHLMKAGWFREAVRQWNEELEAKLYSEGMDTIRDIAMGEDAKALNAAKYLANKEFRLSKGGSARGRPSNEEVEGRLASDARDRQSTIEDAERIRLIK